MIQYTLSVDGMQCGMCEAHVNDAIRKAFPVKKVHSSRGKGETVIVSEQELDPQKLREAIEATGYRVLSVASEPYKKKGLFSR